MAVWTHQYRHGDRHWCSIHRRDNHTPRRFTVDGHRDLPPAMISGAVPDTFSPDLAVWRGGPDGRWYELSRDDRDDGIWHFNS
jgi:hypothetical protein